MDDHYVDRVEKKLLSPEKESINPSKAFAEATVKEKLKEAELKQIADCDDETKAADSGLDSSANSDEAHDKDKFVDRRENVLSVVDPESILSPPKLRDHQFNFVDNQSQSRLDAVNNNSETAVEWTASSEDVNNQPGSPDYYLGKVVSLHDVPQSGQSAENQVSSVDVQLMGTKGPDAMESTMNLYWYSTTLDLDVDPKELEEFQTTQASTSFTSTFNMSVGDDYYREKNKDDQLPVTDNRYTESSIESKQEDLKLTQESWTSAFESASTRFLDLASEMKTEPKSVKNRENSSIKKADNGKEQHPWGLDADTRMKTEVVTVLHATDELPELDSVIPDTKVDVLIAASETKEDIVDGKQCQIAMDEADAVGYMELADKEKVLSNVKKNDKNEKKHKDGTSEKAHKDQMDAVGYMEKMDKPVVEKLVSSESANLNLVQSNVTLNQKDNSKVTSTVDTNVISKQVRESDVDAGVKGIDTPDSALFVQEALVKETVSKVETAALEVLGAGAKVKQQEEVFEPTGIERKFKTADDTEDRIIDAGGELICTEKIIDEYLDDSSFTLTLKDSWLRFRNKRLEMKVNASLHCSRNGQDEISDWAEIRKILLKKFPKVLVKKDEKKQISQLLEKAGLVEFVTHETVRKRYQVGDCVVMLDQTDFGFQVGQIEATARNPRRVVGMLVKMQDLAQKLNLRPLQSL